MFFSQAMGKNCVVYKCSTGYRRTKREKANGIQPEYVPLYRFPDPEKSPEEAVRYQQWINSLKIPREYEITKNSRVCKKHFDDRWIVEDSTDKRSYIREKKDGLQRSRLKDNAIPTIIQGVPSYLSTTLTPERSGRATASSRRAAETTLNEQQIEQFVNEDKLTDLNDLLSLLRSTKYTIPQQYHILSYPNRVVLAVLENEDLIPAIMCSITISADFTWSASMRGQSISNNFFKSACDTTTLTHFAQVCLCELAIVILQLYSYSIVLLVSYDCC